ncbi:uncharacterized protein LOC132376418 [Balaenoptera ricei]|uniref:uncharacterized protein LOC132376418 n=1 Tax=Balaenoptera ricei TaxID=2746895 RepID=UPI0028BD7B4B|nr:uncharacterized protein LOC132376418 [Balaenoptera ricei]
MLKMKGKEELQDGGGVRRGDHFPPHKYIRNTSTRGTAPIEHPLNAGRRPQTSQKEYPSDDAVLGTSSKLCSRITSFKKLSIDKLDTYLTLINLVTCVQVHVERDQNREDGALSGGLVWLQRNQLASKDPCDVLSSSLSAGLQLGAFHAATLNNNARLSEGNLNWRERGDCAGAAAVQETGHRVTRMGSRRAEAFRVASRNNSRC